MKHRYSVCVLVLSIIIPRCLTQDFTTSLSTIDSNASFSTILDQLHRETTQGPFGNETTTLVNQPEPQTSPPLVALDHRLFYRKETYRMPDGSHDGKWVTTNEMDVKKVGDYYFEHIYPELWLLHMDNWPPGYTMYINSFMAGLFQAQGAITLETDRNFDLALYISVGSLGVIVNVIMLVVMLSNKDLQTPTNILLCSVAIADICYLVINPTSTILREYYKREVKFDDHFCKTFQHLTIGLYCLTVLHNTAVACERYLAICWPMKVVAICTKKRSLKIAAGLWVLAFILPAPLTKCMYMVGNSINPDCLYVFDTGHYGLKLIAIYSVVVLFVVPVCFMLFSYISITVTLMRSVANTRKMTSDKKDGKEDKSLQARMQVIKLLWVICLLFLLSWLPNAIIDLTERFDDNIHRNIINWFNVNSLTFIQRVKKISYINSTMNPIVFFFMAKSFRDHTIRMMTCGKVVVKKDVSTTSQMTMSTTMATKQTNAG